MASDTARLGFSETMGTKLPSILTKDEGSGDSYGDESDTAFGRYINLGAVFNFGVVLLCSWTVFALTFQLALANGGPASMVYGSIFAGFGTTAVAASLAELAAIDPTVGAQYRWSARYAPFAPRFWGLLQGWITVFAWIATAAGNPSLMATVIQSLVSYNNENYVPQRWHVTLMMWAFILLAFFGNLGFRRILNTVESLGAVCMIASFIVLMATLLALAPRSSSELVFGTLTKGSTGWSNLGAGWSIGLLTVTYGVSAFDGVIHMSEEVKKVRQRVPIAIVSSVVINAILQFAFVVCLLYSIGDYDDLTSYTNLPIIEVFDRATGSKAATTVLVLMPTFILFLATFNIFASVSRLIWKFADDQGIPFSSFFSYIHPKLKIPLNALCLVGTICFLLAIIYIGSSTAFGAIISLSAIGLFISYFVPTLFILLRRLRGPRPEYGSFRLGPFGAPVNVLALMYLAYIIIWVPLPTALPVTASNMNYAGPILSGVIFLALCGCISGRKRFRIPIAPLCRGP